MNWLPYLPLDNDVQVSRNTDFEACASYSATHIAEMILRRKTGLFWEFSERALAKLSDTQPWGNSLDNVTKALTDDGLILVGDWPELAYSTDYVNIDWATYYATIPQTVLKRAYRVQASYKPLSPSQVAAALNIAPLWTIIRTSGGQLHIVAQINNLQYYDSYEVRVKWFQPAEPIISQHQLIINFENMPNAVFYHKTGTKEFGIAFPKIDENALIDMALNCGLPITKPDGTVDFTLAKEVTGL